MATETRPPFEITDTRLAAAGAFFASREVYGLAWIDADLVVRGCFGTKAAFIVAGRPVTDSVTPLIGLEPQMYELQGQSTGSLELPAVVIHSGPDHQDRFNLSLFWSREGQTYYLLMARADLNGTLEIELLRQVRARLMAEAETKAKSDALAQANRDLENYAAIISHDLQAPMRALRSVAGEAVLALQSGNTPEALRQLDWISAQTRRMTAMLSGLLVYSSIGRKVEAIEQVDTRAVAEAVRDSVPASGGKAVIVSGEWPVIETLKAPLELVLRNLVDNAVKHHDRPNGTITLACAEAVDTLVITVSDDGPGIPQPCQEVIFAPFRTLAGPEAPAGGIGLGLALVRRTLESVGGGVQVLSRGEAERGTTFEIRWPRTITP